MQIEIGHSGKRSRPANLLQSLDVELSRAPISEPKLVYRLLGSKYRLVQWVQLDRLFSVHLIEV